MIDMYDESPAPAGSVSTAKLGFGIAAIGICLAFCYPMLASDKEDGMSMLLGNYFDGLTMMYLGAAMMIGGFLLARMQFEDNDNRRGRITRFHNPGFNRLVGSVLHVGIRLQRIKHVGKP